MVLIKLKKNIHPKLQVQNILKHVLILVVVFSQLVGLLSCVHYNPLKTTVRFNCVFLMTADTNPQIMLHFPPSDLLPLHLLLAFFFEMQDITRTEDLLSRDHMPSWLLHNSCGLFTIWYKEVLCKTGHTHEHFINQMTSKMAVQSVILSVLSWQRGSYHLCLVTWGTVATASLQLQNISFLYCATSSN